MSTRRYIIRSDPLAHVPEDAPVVAMPSRGTPRNLQDLGAETRDETHL